MTLPEDRARDARRRARSKWPVRKFRLGEEPPDDFSHLTPDERVALVETVTLRAWALAGRSLPPRLPRSEWPGKITRRR